MKRILAAGSIAALAMVGFAGPAECCARRGRLLRPDTQDRQQRCLAGIDNVGHLVQAVGGGQAKNAAANDLC